MAAFKILSWSAKLAPPYFTTIRLQQTAFLLITKNPEAQEPKTAELFSYLGLLIEIIKLISKAIERP
jgi:hypothetical protein